MPPLELSEWGEGGPPHDYDPQAPTGPLPLGDLTEVAEVAEVAVVAPVPDAPEPDAPEPDAPEPGAAGSQVVVPPEAPPLEPALSEPAVLEPAVPEPAVPEPAVPERGESAGGGGPGRDGELTPPGTNITVVPGQIGYPRDVVPGAELVKRVSSDEGTQLPHWADPPTGEVPRALAGVPGADDDLQGWRLLGSKGLRWREDMSDWSDGPGVEDLVDRDEGRANPMEPPAGNRFSFDEDFERLERQRAERASTAADATVEIVDVAGAAAGVAGQGTGHGEVSGGVAPALAAEGPGDGLGGPEVGAPRQATPQQGTTGSERVAGAGAPPLFVEPVGEAKGPVGTAAAGPAGRPVGDNGEGVGAPGAGSTGPSPSGGEGEMADRTATRTPGRGQAGLGRAGRTPSPRRRVTSGLPTTWGPKPGDLAVTLLPRWARA